MSLVNYLFFLRIFMMKNVLLILLLLCFNAQSRNSLILSYTPISYGFSLPFLAGSHSTNLYLRIDSPITTYNSSNGTECNITVDGLTSRSQHLYGKIKQNQIIIEADYYQNYDFYGLIFFPLSNNDNDSKLMDHLYNTNQIHKKILSIDQTKNQIYLGEVPDYNYKRLIFSECQSLPNTWGCEVTSVYFENTNNGEIFTLSTKAKIIFTLQRKEIFAPEKDFNLLLEKYFSKYINEKKCMHFQNALHCDTYIFDKLCTTLNFEIGNYILNLPIDLYFINSMWMNKKQFIIQQNIDFPENKDYLIFGNDIFSSYLRTFDYEQQKIYLYDISRGNVLSIKTKTNKKNSILTPILIFLSFFLFFGIFVLFTFGKVYHLILWI